jgi:hypothetical protein
MCALRLTFGLPTAQPRKKPRRHRLSNRPRWRPAQCASCARNSGREPDSPTLGVSRKQGIFVALSRASGTLLVVPRRLALSLMPQLFVPRSTCDRKPQARGDTLGARSGQANGGMGCLSLLAMPLISHSDCDGEHNFLLLGILRRESGPPG